MTIGMRVMERLVKGYRLLSEQRMLKPSVTPPVTAIRTPSGEVWARIAEQPIGVMAERPLPVKPEAPMEVKGALELVRPKREIPEGFGIPAFRPSMVRMAKIKPREEPKVTQLTYPLIPRKPAKGEPVFAYAKIYWNDKKSRYVYELIEPKLSPKLDELLKRVKDLLEQRLDIDFSKLRKFEAKDYLNKQITEIINYFGFKITEREKAVLRYYVERDFIGLARIEPFMQDDQIEDISCDGIGIPIFIFHRNPKLGSIVSNIVYDSADELDSFITRLAQLCGKSISVAVPLLDGSLPDGSRLQATLATDIARRGSNFTIRKFTKSPLTPTHLLSYGTLDVRALAYLWLVVDFGGNILVSGGTASGKTSLLNALSLFIRPEKKIISIEDTAELRLPHPHWVPSVARTVISGERAGEVDLFDLLKESFRQRPDYIIVGEVRGKEAYILFQQMATGHPSLATIHSENISKLMDRLTTPPISLPPGLIGSLDLIVFLSRMRYREKLVRKVNEILEMIEYDEEARKPIVNTVFKWDPKLDRFEAVGKSIALKKISERTGISEQEILNELERRMLVLEWMKERNISDYRDVSKVVNAYYSYPQRLLSVVMRS